VEKQRRLAHNLPPVKAAAPAKPVEVGAIWSDPAADGSGGRIHGGHFTVNPASAAVAQVQPIGRLPIPAWLEPAILIPAGERHP
jgi:hypothetical protein